MNPISNLFGMTYTGFKGTNLQVSNYLKVENIQLWWVGALYFSAAMTHILNLQDFRCAPSLPPRHNNLGPFSSLICRKLPQVPTSKHLVAASATSMVGFPVLFLSVRSWNNGFGPRSPVHRLCLLSFSRPPPVARCPSQGRRPSHSLLAIELHHRFKWSEKWINLAGNQRTEKHLHKHWPSAGKFLMTWGNA